MNKPTDAQVRQLYEEMRANYRELHGQLLDKLTGGRAMKASDADILIREFRAAVSDFEIAKIARSVLAASGPQTSVLKGRHFDGTEASDEELDEVSQYIDEVLHGPNSRMAGEGEEHCPVWGHLDDGTSIQCESRPHGNYDVLQVDGHIMVVPDEGIVPTHLSLGKDGPRQSVDELIADLERRRGPDQSAIVNMTVREEIEG